jgi:photosystem II stability/assembly factor-like uncharacterized protein
VLKKHRTLRYLYFLLSTLLVFVFAACMVNDSRLSNFQNTGAAQEATGMPMTGSIALEEPTAIPSTNNTEDVFVATKEAPVETDIIIQHLVMIDGDNGWGMDEESRLLITNDGGISWQNVTPPLGEFEWSGFYALDMEYAWLVPTREDCVTKPCSAYQIWHTYDGGRNWKAGAPLCTGSNCTMHNSTPVDFAKPVQVHFIDEANGWVLLNINHVVDIDHYRIYRTRDGGESWDFVVDHNDGPQTYQVTGLSFIAENNGWLTTSDLSNTDTIRPNWFVYRSYDGGESWKKYQVPEPDPLPEIFSEYEYSCGITQLEVNLPEMMDMKVECIVFADEDVPFTFHYHSLTAGKNWSRWEVPEKADFVNVVSGWQIQQTEAGYELQNTRDGGANWHAVAQIPWKGELHFPNDSTGFAIVHEDDTHILYRSVDGGETWLVIEPVLSNAPRLKLADEGIQEFFLSGPNGDTFPVVYYPPSTSSAPAVILMHQVNMDLFQWDAIARWLWKGDISEYTDKEHPWLDSSWFPDNTLEERPAVFVFTYRECNNGCGSPDSRKVLNDAQTVINYAINQPEIDADRITVVGTSVSADAALDACFLMYRESGFECENVVSLSPGSYLDFEYVSVVKEMKKSDTNVYCYASRADSESADLCMGNRPSDSYYYFVGKGLQHGVELFAPDYEVNMLEELIKLIGG